MFYSVIKVIAMIVFAPFMLCEHLIDISLKKYEV